MQQLSPAMQTRIKQQEYKINNPSCSNPNITESNEIKFKQLNEDVISLSQNNEFDYSFDDGVISDVEKIKNFGKGMISPITNMFSSPKSFLIGAGMIAAGAALTIATGGAIAPLFVALGVTGGAIQLGVSAYKAKTATTDEEARQAWQGMGAGTSSIVGSVAGSKAALKGAGVDTKGMNALTATVECFKQVPNAASKSIGAFTSGQALVNIKNVFKSNKVTNTNDTPEAKPKIEVDSQVTETKAGNEVLDAQIEPQTQIDTPEITQQQSDVEIKPVENVSEAKVEPKTTLKQEHDVPEFQQHTTDTIVESSKNATSSNLEAVKPQAQETPLVQEIVKEDGTKITLTRNENGQITKSVIKKPGRIKIEKNYQNGKCISTMETIYGAASEYKAFEYDAYTGKISKISDMIHETEKLFNYDNNKVTIETVDVSQVNSYLSNDLDYNDTQISEAISKLKQVGDIEIIKGNNVVRKTTILNKETGLPVDVYITRSNNGMIRMYTSDGELVGSMTYGTSKLDLPNSSASYKNGNYLEIHSLQNETLGKNEIYKGIGTEMVKQAVIDSYDNGKSGRIALMAGDLGRGEPDAFYYKLGFENSGCINQKNMVLPECKIVEFLTK